jgi:hypothetical protein
MSSFWMPKKQPLYAPMLGTFGGGSPRGFGRGIGRGRLYRFTSFLFTAGGTSVQSYLPPSSATVIGSYDTTANPWLNNTSFFSISNGIQKWTVPEDGDYQIEANGAAGGDGGSNDSSGIGGQGARMIGTFSLTQGQKLEILIGHIGKSGPNYGAGGGGGTFVVEEGATTNAGILVIAGGGGGAGYSANRNGVAGSTGTSGTTAADGTGNPGTNGNGAPAFNAGSHNGQGGSGFFTDAVLDPSNDGEAASVAKSYLNGGEGGLGGGSHGTGGYGGFGGGGAPAVKGGGGGGYSGGTHGAGSYTAAGGGGSFNSGTNQTNTSGANSGSGKVSITLL